MLKAIFSVLIGLWAIAWLTGYVLGGLIHLLLLLAVIVLLIEFLEGRKVF